MFNSLCIITGIGGIRGNQAITLNHHTYSNLRNRWTREPSRPQPFITLMVSVRTEDYHNLGFSLSAGTRSLPLPIMADTGCQSCLAGMHAISTLGLSRANLIPVTMTMSAANEGDINIIGAAILRFAGTLQHAREMRQITYITDSSEKIFLSQDACVALGMISKTFPT